MAPLIYTKLYTKSTWWRWCRLFNKELSSMNHPQIVIRQVGNIVYESRSFWQLTQLDLQQIEARIEVKHLFSTPWIENLPSGHPIVDQHWLVGWSPRSTDGFQMCIIWRFKCVRHWRIVAIEITVPYALLIPATNSSLRWRQHNSLSIRNTWSPIECNN